MNKLLIFPTDTVYGIGCGIFDKKNIDKIYEIKHRPRSKPLACLCANLKQIQSIAYIGEKEQKIIEKLMPGALTIILKAKEEVKNVTGFDTIGVRIPNSKTAQKILLENGPMLTTSVNESEKVPLNNYEEIYERYNNVVDKIYPSNEPSSSISSTVVSLLKGDVQILREGQIKLDDIKNIIGYWLAKCFLL